MKVGTKEHYEILSAFEKIYTHLRLDKEDKKLWQKGIIYANGETNKLYEAFINGYSFGSVNCSNY